VAKKTSANAKHTALLVAIGRHAAEFFRSPDGDAWATFTRGNHRETWPTDSKEFRAWLTNQFFQTHGVAPGLDALANARNLFTALALEGNVVHPVFVRVAELNGAIYIDLGDPNWRTIEVDKNGWRTIDQAPVPFHRIAIIKPLPEPERGGSIELLRPFLNCNNDEAFQIRVFFILNGFNTNGTHAVLCLIGQEGSGKSGEGTRIRQLVDPFDIEPQSLKRDERDIFVGAAQQRLPIYDNVPSLSDEQSNALCKMTSGGGYLERELRTNKGVAFIKVKCPVIITSTGMPIVNTDLADRAQYAKLDSIPADKRRDEVELQQAFTAAAPKILGAVLDGVTEALRRRDLIKPPNLPRLADYAKFAIAAETAYWPEGTFMNAYRASRTETVTATLKEDDAIDALQTFMNAMEVDAEGKPTTTPRTNWSGQLKRLYDQLTQLVGQRTAKGKNWPSSPRGLRSRLDKAKIFLAEIGLQFKWTGKTNRGQTIAIWKTGTPEPADKDDDLFADQTSTATANGSQQDAAAGPDPRARSAAASVPFMVTAAMKAQLRARGYTDEAIRNLTPQQAHDALAHPPELNPDRCIHCGMTADRAGLLQPCSVNGEQKYIHAHCLKARQHAQQANAAPEREREPGEDEDELEPIRPTGRAIRHAVPLRVCCAVCGQHDNDLYPYRHGAVDKVWLHQGECVSAYTKKLAH
jgi:hypothetical protein